MGNLDPTEVFLRGNPATVEAASKQLISEMADCKRFIISSGCDVPPGASLENLSAFEKAVCLP
jgi:uroporphyrinogen decarboxylase